MKKVFISSLLLCSSFLVSFSQVPQKFSYQAVAVDASGLEMKNTSVCLRATIISNAINGTQQWVEVHSPVTTDDFGLFTIEIGAGDPVGGALAEFADVKWGDTKHFLRVEMSLDAQGCSNFILVGTNQLLSVPYSLYAEKSDTAAFALTSLTNVNDADPDPTNELQNLQLNGNQLTLSGSTGSPINLSAFNVADPDADPTNELQNLQLNGSQLSLSGSTSPAIDLNASDPDHDPTNELQNLQLNGNQLTLSGSTGSPINLSAFNVADPDADPTNELQNLVVSGTTITLTGSNAPPIDMNIFNSVDGDTNSSNELQNLQINGSQLSLSNSTSPVIDLNASDPDHDPTNELQNLSANGSMLSLSGSAAPPVDMNASDPDHDPTNELQELTFDSTQSLLGLSGSSTHIDLSNLTNFNASGSDLDFPQGVANAKYVFVPDDYVVPADSVFYVVASEDEILLPGIGNYFGRHLTGPNLPVFKAGTQVDNCRCIGFLKEAEPFFEPVIVVLKENQGNFYQVPFQKNFIIKSGLDQSTPITLNGYTMSPFSTIIKALVIPEAVQIKNLGNDEIILTGYLINK